MARVFRSFLISGRFCFKKAWPISLFRDFMESEPSNSILEERCWKEVWLKG